MKFKFRKTVSEDFSTLHKWLHEKHVREFFQPEDITPEQVISKYQPRLDENHPVKMHMALLNNNACAYLQSYRVIDFPEHAKTLEEDHGFAIDYFIGEPLNINRGLGSQLIDSYISFVAKKAFPEEKVCFVCVRKDNFRSVCACKNAGLKEVRRVIEDGYPSLVLRKDVEDCVPHEPHSASPATLLR